jgi:8-oxo-dGTP pyrophosphatase MutT (NUDIX family)
MDKAYGGVIINEHGQVLLRAPRGQFGGYVWTFAKGRPNSGETEEETALREVLEETGICGKILAKIPGSFLGSTTVNEYFLMIPAEDKKHFDEKETQSVRWVTQRDAEQLIAKTTDEVGKGRDLTVLKSAFETLRSATAKGTGLGPPQPEQNQLGEQNGTVRGNLSWRTAIIEVLRTAQKPLRPAEIVAAIKERGLRPVRGRTPEATAAANIYSSIKKDGDSSPFRQTGSSEFILKRPQECSGAPAPIPLPDANTPNWQPGDEFQTVGAIRNGDIICFEFVDHKKFLMKTLSEEEAAAFRGKKYRIQCGEAFGSFDLVAV